MLLSTIRRGARGRSLNASVFSSTSDVTTSNEKVIEGDEEILPVTGSYVPGRDNSPSPAQIFTQKYFTTNTTSTSTISSSSVHLKFSTNPRVPGYVDSEGRRCTHPEHIFSDDVVTETVVERNEEKRISHQPPPSKSLNSNVTPSSSFSSSSSTGSGSGSGSGFDDNIHNGYHGYFPPPITAASYPTSNERMKDLKSLVQNARSDSKRNTMLSLTYDKHTGNPTVNVKDRPVPPSLDMHLKHLSENSVEDLRVRPSNELPLKQLTPLNLSLLLSPPTTPKDIARLLDLYVIGQTDAKKVLATAVCDHINLLRSIIKYEHRADAEKDKNKEKEEDGNEVNPADFPPPNILLMGPSGSGKTHVITTLFTKILSLPYNKCDATTYTASGYVGSDVGEIVKGLVSNLKGDDGPTYGYRDGSRGDKGIFEDYFNNNDVTDIISKAGFVLPTYLGTQKLTPSVLFNSCGIRSGGVEDARFGVVLLDEIDKIACAPAAAGGLGGQGRGTVNSKEVQTGLLRIMEDGDYALSGTPADKTKQDKFMDQLRETRAAQSASLVSKKSQAPPKPKMDPNLLPTKHILFVFSGAFNDLNKHVTEKYNVDETREESEKHLSVLHLAQTEDFVKVGFEPEFMGRIPVRVALANLTKKDLVSILLNPKGGSVLQRSIFDFAGYSIDLKFSEDAIESVAEMALSEKVGARGLGTIVERTLRDLKYELPGRGSFKDGEKKVLLIDRAFVEDKETGLKTVLENWA